jgi:hypothetical protein
MTDTDAFSDVEILALTAIGESEELGEKGMQQTINTVTNRVNANLEWMGGSDVRTVCLQPGQYDCWNPGKDRDRIISIGLQNPSYAPYVTALGLAASALAGDLPDITNGAVSYGDDGEHPEVHPGSQPCLVDGSRVFYDLAAVA